MGFGIGQRKSFQLIRINPIGGETEEEVETEAEEEFPTNPN